MKQLEAKSIGFGVFCECEFRSWDNRSEISNRSENGVLLDLDLKPAQFGLVLIKKLAHLNV